MPTPTLNLHPNPDSYKAYVQLHRAWVLPAMAGTGFVRTDDIPDDDDDDESEVGSLMVLGFKVGLRFRVEV